MIDGGEGAQDLAFGFRLRPQPDVVDMSMAGGEDLADFREHGAEFGEAGLKAREGGLHRSKRAGGGRFGGQRRLETPLPDLLRPGLVGQAGAESAGFRREAQFGKGDLSDVAEEAGNLGRDDQGGVGDDFKAAA